MLTKFGKLVRKFRIDEHMKLGEMATGVGVTAAYLSAVENGKKNLTGDLVNKIIMLLDLENDDAADLLRAADLSRTEHRIDVTNGDDQTRETVAMFARSIESSELSPEKAEQILNILKD